MTQSMQYGPRDELIDSFMKWNSQINLSAIREPDAIYEKHIVDSLELLKLIDLKPGKKLLDVGTGGGFPLLPLAKTYPEVECVGLDSRKKKLHAVQAIAEDIGADNVKTVWARAEDHQETYDYVTVRAVSYIDTLLPRVSNLLKPEGRLILYKQYTKEEHRTLLNIRQKFGLQLLKEHRYGDDRILYLLKKKFR